MGKKKRRKDRWSRRETIKEYANRLGVFKMLHPQVRRQLQKDKY